MMFTRGIDHGDHLHVPGIDLSNAKGSNSRAQIVQRNTRPDGTEYIVVKHGGGKHWSARGEQSHSPTEYTVLKVTSETIAKGKRHLTFDYITSVPVRTPTVAYENGGRFA